jgi:hypothetical protein
MLEVHPEQQIIRIGMQDKSKVPTAGDDIRQVALFDLCDVYHAVPANVPVRGTFYKVRVSFL